MKSRPRWKWIAAGLAGILFLLASLLPFNRIGTGSTPGEETALASSFPKALADPDLSPEQRTLAFRSGLDNPSSQASTGVVLVDDVTGEPLGAVKVSLREALGKDAQVRPWRTVKTNELGFFPLGPPGVYQVEIVLPGYVRQRVFIGSTGKSNHELRALPGSTLEVVANDVNGRAMPGIEVVLLPPSLPTPGNMVREDIRERCEHASSIWQLGRINLSQHTGLQFDLGLPLYNWERRSGADGRIVFEDLEGTCAYRLAVRSPDGLRLIVSEPKSLGMEESAPADALGSDSSLAHTEEFCLSAGGTLSITLGAEAATSIVGVIPVHQDAPLSLPATARLLRMEGEGRLIEQVRPVDASGRFAFEHIAPGNKLVRVTSRQDGAIHLYAQTAHVFAGEEHDMGLLPELIGESLTIQVGMIWADGARVEDPNQLFREAPRNLRASLVIDTHPEDYQPEKIIAEMLEVPLGAEVTLDSIQAGEVRVWAERHPNWPLCLAGISIDKPEHYVATSTGSGSKSIQVNYIARRLVDCTLVLEYPHDVTPYQGEIRIVPLGLGNSEAVNIEVDGGLSDEVHLELNEGKYALLVHSGTTFVNEETVSLTGIETIEVAGQNPRITFAMQDGVTLRGTVIEAVGEPGSSGSVFAASERWAVYADDFPYGSLLEDDGSFVIFGFPVNDTPSFLGAKEVTLSGAGHYTVHM